jgi:hypothetical protein
MFFLIRLFFIIFIVSFSQSFDQKIFAINQESENSEKKLMEGSISKDFINLFIDDELRGLLDEILNEIITKNKFLINIKYVDQNFYKISENFPQGHIGIILSKNQISEDMKKKFMLDGVLNLGGLKYSFCINQNNEKIQEINDIFEKQNFDFIENKKFFSELNNAFAKNNSEILKIGINKDFIIKEKYKNLNIITYDDQINLWSKLKKNEIDLALIPNILCMKIHNGQELQSFEKKTFNLNQGELEYRIFFNNSFSKLILDILSDQLNLIFQKNK